MTVESTSRNGAGKQIYLFFYAWSLKKRNINHESRLSFLVSSVDRLNHVPFSESLPKMHLLMFSQGLSWMGLVPQRYIHLEEKWFWSSSLKNIYLNKMFFINNSSAGRRHDIRGVLIIATGITCWTKFIKLLLSENILNIFFPRKYTKNTDGTG